MGEVSFRPDLTLGNGGMTYRDTLPMNTTTFRFLRLRMNEP